MSGRRHAELLERLDVTILRSVPPVSPRSCGPDVQTATVAALVAAVSVAARYPFDDASIAADRRA